MVNVGELEVGIGNGGQGCQVVMLGCSMARRKSRVCIELGVQKMKVLSYGESIRVVTEPIRWAILKVKHEFLRILNRLSGSVNRFVFVQRPKLVILNRFVTLESSFQLQSSRVDVVSKPLKLDSSESTVPLLNRFHFVARWFSRVLPRTFSGYISCIVRPCFYKIYTVSLGVRGVKRTRCSAYGNSGPLGVIDDVKDRLRSGPDNWSSRKYERWLSGASSESVGLDYDNRPGELILAYRNRHSSCAFA
ncbi:hypothetical protein PIB30_032904 [Stylosanthes scabra]|uniref:Uncharacterized protein n=1 Tax=Stylosanthes scabra TaxID=79078 RepID=A0ABU6UB33_9FABA|nr:hypothetical protein [Stylosanthes scabra]